MVKVNQAVSGCSLFAEQRIKCTKMPQSAYEESMAKHFIPSEFDQYNFNFPPEPEQEISITQSIDQIFDQKQISQAPSVTTVISQSIDQIFSQQPVSEATSVTTGILESITPETTQETLIWGKETIQTNLSSELPNLSTTISTFFENATSEITQQVAGTTKEDNFIVGQVSSTANSTATNTTLAIDEIFGNSSSITEIIDSTTDAESNVTDVMTYVNHTMRDIGNNTDSSTGDHPHVQSAVVIMCVVVGLLLALILVGSVVYYFNKNKIAGGESKINFFQQRESHVAQSNETIILADSSRTVQDSYGSRL